MKKEDVIKVLKAECKFLVELYNSGLTPCDFSNEEYVNGVYEEVIKSSKRLKGQK